MVLAAPGLLLTPPPSSSPPKTPHRSYSAQTLLRADDLHRAWVCLPRCITWYPRHGDTGGGGSGSQHSARRLPGSRQVQCTSWRNFASFSSPRRRSSCPPRCSSHRPPVAVSCTRKFFKGCVMSSISTPSFSEMMLRFSEYVCLRASIIFFRSAGYVQICSLRLCHKYSSKFALSKKLVLYCHGILPDIDAGLLTVFRPGMTALNFTVATLSTLLEHSCSSHVAEKSGGSRPRRRRSSIIVLTSSAIL